jgi:hypothetical protein
MFKLAGPDGREIAKWPRPRSARHRRWLANLSRRSSDFKHLRTRSPELHQAPRPEARRCTIR